MISVVARYTPESWDRLRTVAPDVVMTHAEYNCKTDRLVQALEDQGNVVRQVTIDVDDMVAWCRRKGYSVSDSRARSAYGAALALGNTDAPFDDRGLLGPRAS